MSLACKRDGKVEEKIKKKGVLLQRRDNAKVIRDIYAKTVMNIFHNVSKEETLKMVQDQIEKMCNDGFEMADFVITKSVGEISEYKVRALPDDPVKRAKRLKDLRCNEDDYWIYTLPAQAQLAERMKKRGQPVMVGTRLEYVVTTNGGHKALQGIKIEDYTYFKRHSGYFRIDYLYYLKLLSNPLDEMLEIIYGTHNFVLDIYKEKLSEKKVKLIFNG